MVVLKREVKVLHNKEVPLVKVHMATSEGIRVGLGAEGWNEKALSGFVQCSRLQG